MIYADVILSSLVGIIAMQIAGARGTENLTISTLLSVIGGIAIGHLAALALGCHV